MSDSAAQHQEERMSTSGLAPPHILFYDGECGLCTKAVKLIKRKAPLHPIEYVDVTDDEAMARYPQIEREEALEQVTLLTPDGKQLTGYDAVTGVVRLLPRWRHLHALARLWPVQLAGHAGYSVVGHNRHKISRMLGWE